MTQEEKQFLLQDLCARLPYDVQGITSEGVIAPLLHRGEADWDILTSLNYRIVKHGWRPYLRPMSSMTEEEKRELFEIGCEGNIEHPYGLFFRSQDWLNAHHLDYRGLIEKELALEAPEGMYDIKTE